MYSNTSEYETTNREAFYIFNAINEWGTFKGDAYFHVFTDRLLTVYILECIIYM